MYSNRNSEDKLWNGAYGDDDDTDQSPFSLPGFHPSELGSIKKEQLAESIEADKRNGETTPLFDIPPEERANIVTRRGQRITVNQMVNAIDASFKRKLK